MGDQLPQVCELIACGLEPPDEQVLDVKEKTGSSPAASR